MGEFEGSLCHVEYSLLQHVTDARHTVSYMQSCHETAISDDHQSSNDHHHVCSPHNVALQKAVRSDMFKHILRARTQMVESMYKYYDVNLSESHRAKLYIHTHTTGPKVHELQQVFQFSVAGKKVFIVTHGANINNLY